MGPKSASPPIKALWVLRLEARGCQPRIRDPKRGVDERVHGLTVLDEPGCELTICGKCARCLIVRSKNQLVFW
jgi:hypothetical protein